MIEILRAPFPIEDDKTKTPFDKHQEDLSELGRRRLVLAVGILSKANAVAKTLFVVVSIKPFEDRVRGRYGFFEKSRIIQFPCRSIVGKTVQHRAINKELDPALVVRRESFPTGIWSAGIAIIIILCRPHSMKSLNSFPPENFTIPSNFACNLFPIAYTAWPKHNYFSRATVSTERERFRR